MRRLLLFLLVMVTGSLWSAPRFWVPPTLNPGAVNTLLVWDEQRLEPFTVEVRRQDSGKLVTTVRGLEVEEALDITGSSGQPLHWAAALLCPDALDGPGVVQVKILGKEKALVAQFTREIKTRVFPTEILTLNPTMSTLRAKPDPRKDKESAQIWALYQKIAPIPLRSLPKFLSPVESPFRLSASFGDTRLFEYSDGTSARDYHHGADFAVPVGTPIHSPAPGVVVMVADRLLTGTTVVLQHGPGIYSVYFHLSKALVAQGEVVATGATFALSGATGLVTGPHLHWEVRCGGVSVDPFDFVKDGLLDTKVISELISSSERSIH